MELYLKLLFFQLLLFVPGKADPGKGDTLLRGVYTANVPLKTIPVTPGKPTNISCFTDRPSSLQSCRWERIPRPNGQRYLIHVKDFFRGPNQDNTHCNCTYKYSGAGFDKGDCSISINNVSEFHFAKWECTLVGVDNSTWIGQLNITESTSVSPGPKPYFTNPNVTNGVTFNETAPSSTEIECCIKTKVNFTSVKLDINWEGRIVALLHEKDSEKENTTYLKDGETCKQLNYTFTPEDNGKRLVCTANFSNNSMEYSTKSFLPININFRPVLSTISNFTHNGTESNSLIIEVKFRANPQPNNSWYLQYDPATGASFIIHENHTKYKTSLHRTQNDSYSSTLEILNLEEEDYRREFQLVLSNPYGTANVPVQLRHNRGLESETYWIIILTGIGTMIFLVLLAYFLFVFIKRKLKYRRGIYSPGVKAKYSIEDENPTVSFK